MRLAGPARATVVLVGWIAAAAVAGFIGVTAIGAVGDGIVGSETTPLSAEQVDDALAARAPTTPGPSGSSTPSESVPPTTPGGSTAPAPTQPPVTEPPGTQPPVTQPAQGPSKIITTSGGTIVTRCVGGSPQISATAAQGYQVEQDPDDEGEGRARVEFESDDSRVRVEIFCVDGVPDWNVEDD